MRADKAIKKLEPYPIGKAVQYSNPGKPTDGRWAKVENYLLFPDGSYHGALLSWGGGRTSTVTVNQLRAYYRTKNNELQSEQ